MLEKFIKFLEELQGPEEEFYFYIGKNKITIDGEIPKDKLIAFLEMIKHG